MQRLAGAVEAEARLTPAMQEQQYRDRAQAVGDRKQPRRPRLALAASSISVWVTVDSYR